MDEPLIIEAVETIPLRIELERVYKGSHYQMPNRCTIITRVRTRDGIVGESYNADEDSGQAEVLRVVNDELAPLVVGEDALATERTYEKMKVILKDQLRDRWHAVQGIACVNSAIWDAVGKSLGVPLHRLWGGYRESLPVIGIGGYYTNEARGIEKEIEFFAGAGLVGMKFKIGKLSPAEEEERFRRAVNAAPEGFRFAVDANQAWTVAQAVEFVERTRELTEIRWFEEPCQWPNDGRAMRDVRLKANVPVAAGQMEYTRSGMRDLMELGAIDVSNYDASWGGGPTEWLKVAALAQTYGVEMAHHEEAQISSHLLAAVPNGTYVEVFHPDRDPIFWEMLTNRPDLRSGEFTLPSAPGFGWEYDESFVRRYRLN